MNYDPAEYEVVEGILNSGYYLATKTDHFLVCSICLELPGDGSEWIVCEDCSFYNHLDCHENCYEL